MMKRGLNIRHALSLPLLLLVLCILGNSTAIAKDSASRTLERLADGGSIGVWNERGELLLSMKTDEMRVPASILKIVTAMLFLEECGPDFRFETLVAMDDAGTLYVKGFGDPFLTSEAWSAIARKLAANGTTRVYDIVLDDSYFTSNLTVPGVGTSTNPFDAMNGALVSNFNTMFVTVDEKGSVTSAEEQTPVTPFMIAKAREKKISGTKRFGITSDRLEGLRLSDSLLRVFLETAGVSVLGKTRFDTMPAGTQVIYRHLSTKTAAQIIADMFQYSNNFIANQLFLVLGARRKGAPATLGKACSSVEELLNNIPGLQGMTVFEGSGISRRNKVSPQQMAIVLQRFFPFHTLLAKPEKGVFVKTGTLRDVQSLAGYYVSDRDPNEIRLFVIMLPGSNGNRMNILRHIRRMY